MGIVILVLTAFGPIAAAQVGQPAPAGNRGQPAPAEQQRNADDPNAYEARCKPLSDVAKMDSIEGKFAALRDARHNVLQAIQQASSAREGLRARLEQYRRELAVLSQPRTSAVAVPSPRDQAERELDFYERSAETLAQRISRLRAENPQADVSKLQAELDEAREKARAKKTRGGASGRKSQGRGGSRETIH